MPISSGASGRPSRLHLPAGVQRTTTKGNDSARRVSTRFGSSERLSVGSNALDQENARRKALKASSIRANEKIGQRANRMQLDRSALRNLNATNEKKPKRRIGNISGPSSNSTTSLSASRYFVSGDLGRRIDNLDININNDINNNNSNSSNNNNNNNGQNSSGEHSNQLYDDASSDRVRSNCTIESNERSAAAANDSSSSSSSSKWLGLLGLLMSQPNDARRKTSTSENERRSQQTNRTMKRATAGHGGRPSLSDAHYSTAATISEPQGSINPSMSPAFHIDGTKKLAANSTRTPASSAGSNAANLHSLSSLHQQKSTTTTIKQGLNLKYVKTLIIVLMSLDFLITIFVHNFASHDEFLIAFTRSKLRLSLVNLIASAVWFIVLAGAILFDVYFVLLVACLVDFASFIILLACSVYHFTHRVDYNLVSMTSLLLLLFAIIILHVYLLALTALTIYLTLAVRRRRKH